MITAEARAVQLENITDSLIMLGLSTTDTQSTITANEKSKSAYAFAQSNSATLSENLETAASNTRAAAETFANWDNRQ